MCYYVVIMLWNVIHNHMNEENVLTKTITCQLLYKLQMKFIKSLCYGNHLVKIKYFD